MSVPKEQLISSVMEWAFLSDTGIAARIEEFAGSYCAYFEYIAEPSLDEGAENRLVYTQIYQTFQQLFETELSNFLAQYGWTSEQFVATCQEELEKEEDNDKWGSVFEIIVSLTDYNIFKSMMLDMKRRHPTLEPPPPQQ